MPTSPAFEPAATFDPTVVAAVLAHMNGDHAADNLLIARAFGDPAATSAEMVALDGEAGYWRYSVDAVTTGLRMPWAAPITQRAEIRREVVALYDRAHARLGTTPREH